MRMRGGSSSLAAEAAEETWRRGRSIALAVANRRLTRGLNIRCAQVDTRVGGRLCQRDKPRAAYLWLCAHVQVRAQHA